MVALVVTLSVGRVEPVSCGDTDSVGEDGEPLWWTVESDVIVSVEAADESAAPLAREVVLLVVPAAVVMVVDPVLPPLADIELVGAEWFAADSAFAEDPLPVPVGAPVDGLVAEAPIVSPSAAA